MSKLPFRIITMVYWVSILIISYYSSKSIKTISTPAIIIVAFLPIYFISFIYNANNLISSGSTYILFNNVYYILFILPFVLTIRSQTIRNIGILLIFAAVVVSLKRTAMLSFGFSMVFYMIYEKNLSYRKITKKDMNLYVFILCALVGYYLYKNISSIYNINWGERLFALTYDGGSTRSDIWASIIYVIKNQDIYYWFFGHGYLGAFPLGGAHNDFLEILFDFGIFGLAVYLWFIILLIKYYFRMKKTNYRSFPAYGVSLLIFLFGSFFSQLVILPYWFLYLPLFWGLIIPDFERYEKLSRTTLRIKSYRGINENSLAY